MREINLDRLRTLLAVAELGSFAQAARALHLAPPTVTQHVAELEARFGVALLLRGRRVAPTSAGQVLAARSRRLLADLDELVADVRLHAKGQRGRVRLGASTGAIAHLLPPALRELAREHAGIDLQVSVTTSADTLARLAAGTLDLGIVALPLPQPPLAGVRIQAWRRDPVLAVVPADWHAPARLTPAWLAGRPLLLNDGSTHLSRLTDAWFARAGQRPTPRIALNYNDAIRSLVAAGWGASLLPMEGQAAAADPRIVYRALRPALWRPLGLAWRAGADEGATRQVIEVLKALPAAPG